MGAGASTPREGDPGKGKQSAKGTTTPLKAEAKTTEYEDSPFAASPFASDDGGDKNTSENRAPGISDRKLKKMALGIPGYKDVQRDYDDTLEDLGSFNHAQTQQWSEGVGPKLERLTDGPLYTKGAKTQEFQAGIDPRALAKKNAQSGLAAAVGPRNRAQPQPPSRSRPGPPPRPGQAPNSVNKAKQRGDGSATNSVVEAPSILARPTAPKEGTPIFTAKPHGGVSSSSSTARGNTGRPIASSRNEQSARGGATAAATAAAAAGDSDAKPTQRVSTPIRTIKTAAPVEDAPDESSSDDDMEDDGKVYDWTAYDTANSPMKTKLKTSSDGSMSSNGALNSSQRSMSTDKLKPPETPPPGGNYNPPGGNNNPQQPPPGKGIPVRPFPDNSSADEDMYATFGGPRVEDNKPVTRPSKVPALAIQSPSSSAESKSYKVAGGDGKGASSPAITGASPPPRPGGKPPLNLNPGASSGAIPTLMTTPKKGQPPSNSSSQMTGGSIPSERQSSRDAIASTSVVPPLASAASPMNPSTQRRAGAHAAPPKPKTKNPHEVKETTDVKRNKAQLPSALIHAKPTAGDWLNKRYIVNNYILLDILGAGSYGEVRLCKDRLTDHLYAVKIFSKDMLRKKKGGATEETYFEDVKREIAVMKKLLHPNVLRLFEVLDDPKVNKMYLILEYMKKGDMINILKTRNGEKASDDDFNFQPLSDLELWNIFRQVAAGIRYLHYQNVVHGDIKPQNLLIGDDGVVKIADFGISKMLHASGQKLADASGTPAFMSPELFDTGKTFSGQLADIWALGATMWMLKFGNPPFIAKNIVALSNKIQNDALVFPTEDIDPKLHDLLENMLNKNPNKRLSLQEVIMHPWMRTQPPPSVKKATTPNDAQTGRAGSKTVNTQFQPPPSYEKDADSAMKDGVKTVTENEIFQSISGNAKVVMDAKEVEDEDVMATKWGDDVFEMVEDDGDSDSDDSVDEDTVDSASMKGGAKGGIGNSSDNSMQNTMQTVNTVATEHSEMSQEEEMLRATRFKMSKKKSAENGLTLSQSEMLDQVPEMARESAKSSSKAEAKPTTPSREEVSSRGSNSSVLSANANSPSRGRRRSSTANGGDDDEFESSAADQLTMDEFGAMMDTLALQPSKEDDADPAVPLPIELSVASFSAQLRNLSNGFGAAYHSEQGQRPTQEDRCVLIPDASTLRGIDESYGEDQLEHLKKMSIACVFDGHSGWRCAQYLSQHLPTTLVGHDKFLSKQPDKALTDTCHNLDAKVGRLLRKEGDTSGCTGVVVLYDGTRKVLTVANVGDSMCVLSRGGRAVKPHKVHRLATMDVAERERIEAAGGQVINNRVDGILAVSRAFGDTAFKSESSDPNDSKVIATPDVVSEVITPMTEFAIIASDGLWDIMTPQNVVNFVRKMLSKNSDLHAAARELTQEALARGSVDNITTIIISWSGVAGESPLKKRMGKA